MKIEKKLYAAPLEGLTGFVWRKAHHEIFGGAEKYYTPFVVANQTRKFKTKEIRDLSQGESTLVPQLLSDKGEHFVWAIKELEDQGFEEINLNIGCPSATVVTRGKGAGMLRDLGKLDGELEKIFAACPGSKISIKTRTGFSSDEDWGKILSVYEKYPIQSLIVHCRYKEQLYKGDANRELFKETLKKTSLPLVYNGDVRSVNDEAFSYGCSLMCGRGLLRNPALFRQVLGGKAASREELIFFHDRLVEGYMEYMQGAVPTLHHMKEFWFYYHNLFAVRDEENRKVLRSKTVAEYQSAARQIMNNCEIISE